MRKLIFSTAFILLASGANAQGSYDFKTVPHADIDQHLVIASDETQTPPNLQGLFWLDNDALFDKVLSFASAKFEPIKNSQDQITGFEAWVPVYDQGIWSWDDSKRGRAAYVGVERSRLVYHLVFNKEFTKGYAAPIFKLNPRLPKLEIPKSMLLSFELNQISENEWNRDSVILGLKHQYHFRRIVDADGNRLPSYDDYLKSLERLGLVNATLPICTQDWNNTLPTSCASTLR